MTAARACGQLVQRLQSSGAEFDLYTGRQPPGRSRASATGPSAHRSTGAGAQRQHHAQPRRRPLAVAGLPGDFACGRARSERPMAAPTLTYRCLRALALAAGLCACAAHAQEVPPPAYQLAAQRAGIPSTVLYAVALQERAASGATGASSRGRGPSTSPASRAATRPAPMPALGLQQAMRSTPHTRIDAGLGQINLGYHQQRYASACDLLDLYRNLAIAAEILKRAAHPRRGLVAGDRAVTTARGWRARRPLSAQRVPPPRPRAGRALNRRGPRRAPGDLP